MDAYQWDVDPDAHTRILHITQQAFRAVMDALARPGQLREVPPMEAPTLANPYLETLVRMLLDSSCTFVATSGPAHDGQFTSLIAKMTYATPVVAADARFAVTAQTAPASQVIDTIVGLSGGNAVSPECGATAFVEVPVLGAGPLFSVRGPGVADEHRFAAGSDHWFIGREGRSDEFPCGIDLILVDEAGRIVCLPRTSVVRRVD